MERRVVIIGGGISGLSAAEAVNRYTKKAGIPTRVVVLEADSSPGGKIKTTRENGFVVETGPHGFLNREPKMLELIDRLNLRSELVEANTSSARRFIGRNGKLRELPSSLLSFLTGDFLTLSGKLRILFEPLIKKQSNPEESVYDFAARRIGREAADVLIDAMVTGIYGGDPKLLNLKSAFPRMFELERDYGSLIRAQLALAFQKRKQLPAGSSSKSTPGAPRGTLHSFRSGLRTIIDALAEISEISTDTSVSKLRLTDSGVWEVENTKDTILADVVVSTAPTYSLAEMCGDLSSDLSTQMSRVRYVPCSVVVHGFEREQVQQNLDGFGFLLPGQEKRSILGSIWASTVFPDHAPQGKVMFRSMVGGARKPELGRLPTQEMAQTARSELEHWLGLSAEPEAVLQRVIRWEKAIPQYERSHASAVEAADEMEKKWRGLFIAGNGFRGAAMVDCVAYGDELGHKVSEYLSSKP